LAYEVGQRNPDEFQVSDPAGVGGSLCFMKVPEPEMGKNRLHLDLVPSESIEAEARQRVRASIPNAGFEFPTQRLTVDVAPEVP
jgi:hypothetical protein